MRNSIHVLLAVLISISSISSWSQEAKYYPNGDPSKWNIQITPFIWLPVISGKVETTFLSKNFDVPSSDLISKLKGAFMITADISKGKVFVTPSYIYTKLGVEETLWSGPGGNDEVKAEPELAMNLVGLNIGIHSYIGEKLILDPYLGFRYNNFKTTITVDGIKDTTTVEEKADFWDPVLGIRALYFPHPRVPLMFKADIGGFDVGSSFSWTATINGGYSVSPCLDLIGGFSAYGVNFIGEAKTGSTASLNLTMYGFDLGVKIFLPKRFQDPMVFKKFK